ncbi:MAG TPA: NrfD/PsrC family molybdoenzyme membrane anchor subunit [Vicinamibacterales bacterium]|nr:NrfD/PsrC family molybdoenzyme membrane anchor subunit [Vicinamibacterales bacterium]
MSENVERSPGAVPVPQSIASAATGYYGLPLLKKPVWTWEIPVYFFVGGAAGAAALIAETARASGADPGLVRHARRMAAAGGLLSPALLISDLGRPARFLYMLRVLKPQSPMSVGVWTVLAFSSAAGAAAGADFLPARVREHRLVRRGQRAAAAAAALTGLGMSTYTGVLLGVTAIPVWARHVRLLPLHFGFSGLGTAVSILQLLGHRERALHRLGIAAAAFESAAGAVLEAVPQRDDDPLRHGRSGTLMRVAGMLSGPVPLLLRAVGRRSRGLLVAAAVATIAGSLATRLAWLAAGRASATDPRTPLDLPDAAGRGTPAR